MASAAPNAQPDDPLTLNSDVPLTYTVQSGDTLWDIASLFLRDPWRWEELWAGNRESLAKAFFSRDSILVWSLTNMKKIRVRYSEVMQDESYSGIRFVRLRSRHEVSEFVAALSASPVK